MNVSFLSKQLLVVLILALGNIANASGSVVMDDTFADGEHQTLAAPSSALWTDSNASDTLTDGAVTNSQGSLTITPATANSSTITAYFTPSGQPVTLDVGDTLIVRARLSFTGLNSANTGANARLGLFNSNGDRTTFAGDPGYALFLNFTTSGGPTNPFAIYRRTNTANTALLTLAADYTQIGASSGGTYQNLANSTDYTVTFTIYRQSATSTLLTTTLTGGNLGANYGNTVTETSSTPNTAFDFFAFRVPQKAFATTVTVKELKVEYISALAPAIVTQPASQSALIGTNSYFTAVASGGAPLSYQWSKDGTPLLSATFADLILSNVQLTDSASYYVTVSNSFGTVTSNTAALNVVAPATSTPPALPSIPQITFNVADYGAFGDGTTDNTTAIQSVLNAAQNAGGGIVRFHAASGAYLCGPLTMGSNINLQLDYGATLKMLPYYSGTASPVPAGYYPLTGTSSYQHLITIKNAHDIAFTGQGTIDGQGQAWWNAFNANNAMPSRPRMIDMHGCNKVLVSGLTLINSPSFHLGANADNLTVFNITINAPSSAPNTDGIDPSGVHLLIQNCTVSDGDDDIVVKPGTAFCSDVTIANCAIGTGHGLSIGGQSNKGLDGMIVKNCTFNGTDDGLKMKADATEGGIVQNVTYSGITMTNVRYPILFYSYYNILGSPGASSGSSSITPTIVNSWNGDSTTVTSSTSHPKTPNQPINSLNTATLSAWKNITVNNLIATGASGYSVIWGLPLPDYLISNVTLNNVSVSGGAGLRIYDATNVQITGATNIGSYVTCNSLAIIAQPPSQSVNWGANMALTAATSGSSGLTNTLPTYRWYFNSNPLSSGTNADGSIITGATTTTLVVNNIKSAEAGNYTFVASNSLDGYVYLTATSGTLAANSIQVSATSSAATIKVITPFFTFVSSYGLDPAGNGAADSDPDLDGVPNLLEFLLGGNPVSANQSIQPTAKHSIVNGNDALVFEFNRNKTAAISVTSTVEYSTDLKNWTPAVDGQNNVTITVTSVDANTEHVTVTIPTGNSRVFARLKAALQ